MELHLLFTAGLWFLIGSVIFPAAQRFSPGLQTWMSRVGTSKDEKSFAMKLFVLGLIVVLSWWAVITVKATVPASTFLGGITQISGAVLMFPFALQYEGLIRKYAKWIFIIGLVIIFTDWWIIIGLTILVVFLGMIIGSKITSVGLPAIWGVWILNRITDRWIFQGTLLTPTTWATNSTWTAVPSNFLIPVGILLLIPYLYIYIPNFYAYVYNSREQIKSFWELYSESKIGLAGLMIIFVFIAIAIIAPYIAPYDPTQTMVGDVFEPPNREHLLGTTFEGRDIFSRIIYGTQISLIIGFVASFMTVIVGTLVGLTAGYYGGYADTVLMRLTDMFLSLPILPFILIFFVIFGPGLINIILVLVLTGWTGTARMVHSQVLSLRERPLTESARAIGAKDQHIIFNHILPNTMPLIFANAILGIVSAILNEAWISYLGFGDIHGIPSWGTILFWADRRGALIIGMWWWLVFPGLCIMLLVLGFAFVSFSLDQILNPRLRKRR